MAAYNKFNLFTDDLVKGVHNFGTHTFKVMLTNTAPVATNHLYGDISATEISSGNGYTTGGQTTSIPTPTNTGGTEKVTAGNVTFTASGGTIGPFRYAVVYNATQTSPASPLVAWFDYGSSVTLNSGETFTWTPDSVNGLYTLA
jgi:hypothetical protein